jgi:hypothetical protein
MDAVCNQLWTSNDGASTDCPRGYIEATGTRCPSNEQRTGGLQMTFEQGKDVQELLRIRAEILAALEQVDEVIAGVTALDR